MKLKKKMEYDYQKQKINEVSNSLEERVSEEQARYAKLKQAEEAKEKMLKDKLDKEIENDRRNMER